MLSFIRVSPLKYDLNQSTQVVVNWKIPTSYSDLAHQYMWNENLATGVLLYLLSITWTMMIGNKQLPSTSKHKPGLILGWPYYRPFVSLQVSADRMRARIHLLHLLYGTYCTRGPVCGKRCVNAICRAVTQTSQTLVCSQRRVTQKQKGVHRSTVLATA